MKLISYLADSDTGYGVVVEAESRVIPVAGEIFARLPSIRAVLENDAVAELADWAAGRQPTLGLGHAHFEYKRRRSERRFGGLAFGEQAAK